MVQNLKFKTFLILAVLILAGYTLYVKDITLGLDLSGGSSLRYELPMPDDVVDPQQVTEDTVAVIRKRVQGLGLKEIPIRVQGDNQFFIELPRRSQAEVDNIVNIIHSQGNLEWLLLAEELESDENDPTISVKMEEEQQKLIAFLQKMEEEKGGWDLNVDLSALSFSKKINDNLIHFFWLAWSEETLEKREEVIPPKNSTFESLGLDPKVPKGIGRFFGLIKRHDKAEWQFTGKDLSSVSPSMDQNQNAAVGFNFNPGRASDFGDFTGAHVDKFLAIVLDGRISTAPRISEEIGGSGIISGPPPGGFTMVEQKNLLTVLRSGSLVVKPVLLSQNTIGPTLGANAIFRGKYAALIGMAVIFVFMIVYYLFAGFIASLALSINLIVLMGILVFLEATLTLPGIAGIVLTVGMAVDANILIFERIREEKDKGKTIAQSIKNGFERAFITIVDANATTFITGFILFQFGTGPIKGFATTLMIGICTSLFAALLVSKVIFALLLEKGAIKQDLTMLRLLKSPNLAFVKAMPFALVCSGLIIVAGLVTFFLADESKYGLDFTGGFNVHLKCHEGTTQKEVQTTLGQDFPNVQVVTVKQGADTGPAEPYTVFDVKIKSTLSDQEARRQEQKKLKDGSAPTDPGIEPEAGTPTIVTETGEQYLPRIKELLGDRLVKEPIQNLTLTPIQENMTTGVEFELYLAKPAEQPLLEELLSGLLTIKEMDFSEDKTTIRVSAVYPREASTVTAPWLQGRIITLLKAPDASGGETVELVDPFPLTGYIGPTVGHQLRDNAIIAIFLSLVGIIIYIRLRFKEYKYGIAAASALVHDVLITLGAVTAARASGLVDVEIDLPLIAAFLTIIGYSLNDTIVVFDRVRENLPRVSLPFTELLNLSVNQTLSRTVLTSLTTLLMVLILFVLNYGQRNVMEGFSFAIIIGVIVGTYSSVFVASPVLIFLHRREQRLAATTK